MDTDSPFDGPTRLVRVDDGTTRLYVAGACTAFVVGVALAVYGWVAPFAHPDDALRRWREALTHGDITALTRDDRLGMEAWTHDLATELGTAEYERVLALHDRAITAGRDEVRRLRAAVEGAGFAAWSRLTWSEQRAIESQSHRTWVEERGFAAVAEAAVLGNRARLFAEPPPPDVLARLGAGALSDEERALLGQRASGDPAVLADAVLTELAARRDEAGARVLRRLRETVLAAGERRFEGLPSREQREIDARSRMDFLLDRGFAALDATDRGRVESASALFADDDELAGRLGVTTLDAAARTELGTVSRRAFVEGREAWIARVGLQRAAFVLQREYARAEVETDGPHPIGDGGRDLVRRRHAGARLVWRGRSGALRVWPDQVDLDWDARRHLWRVAGVHWSRDPEERSRASGTLPAPAAPAPDATPEPIEAPTQKVGGAS